MDLDKIKRTIHEQGLEFVDLLVTDIDGRLRHVTIPAKNFTGALVEQGVGFDASNFGYAQIDDSDMILQPDLHTAFIDPLPEQPKVLFMFCNVLQAHSQIPFAQDMRNIVQKALQALDKHGIGESVWVAPELEFNIIDGLYSRITPDEVAYRITSSEVASPPDGNEIYRIAPHRGYHRMVPNDHIFAIRNEIVNIAQKVGMQIKYHHHEVAASQNEIEFNFTDLCQAAEQTVLLKNFCHRVARKHQKIASFLPRLIPGDYGNGMHVHMYLEKDGHNVFYDPNGLYQLSQTALYFIGGILYHSSLIAITNPTTNSYRRLLPGLEAPVNAVFARANRSAAIRIPGYVTNPQQTRFEFRTIDATCNPYLAFGAIVMAGIDGVINKIDPREQGFGPVEGNLYELPPAELAKIKGFPSSLEKALEALEEDHAYLTRDEVIPASLIEKWISVKRKDIADMRAVPHPWEIARYYDL